MAKEVEEEEEEEEENEEEKNEEEQVIGKSDGEENDAKQRTQFPSAGGKGVRPMPLSASIKGGRWPS